LDPGVIDIKYLSTQFTNFRNKLEGLSLTSFSSQV